MTKTKNYQLIALDMDGTLLTSDKKITAKTLETIEKAIEKGKHVVLSSGRAMDELKAYERELAVLSYGIMESGAIVYDFRKKENVYQAKVAPEMINKIMETAQLEDTMIQFFSEGHSITEQKKIANMREFEMEIYQPMFEKICWMVDDMHVYYEQEKPNVEKINIYHKDTESRLRTYERLKDLPLSFSFSEITSLEISPEGVSKGEGLKKLCEYLGISVEDTICVGDADNDLPILKTAGLAVAMGNANEQVKAVSDVIVSDNDHEGCREAIRKYLLG